MATKGVKSSTPTAPPKRTIRQVATELAQSTDTDVLLYNGPIERALDSVVIDHTAKWVPRRQALLILVTEGGDADAAFRIARCLQQKYERYAVFVTGWCKSAGTLICLGASELVIADHGEMGPLDVQLSRKDELFETQSGLIVTSAFSGLREQAFSAFEDFMLQLRLKSGSAITTHTAMEIASGLAVGLFSQIFAQVDPIQVGETGRANRVGRHYGEMLIAKSQNSTTDQLDHLISHYPSHGFVIDRLEAKQLFTRVRPPNPLESELAKLLGRRGLWPLTAPSEPEIAFLSEQRRVPMPRTVRPKAAAGGTNGEIPGTTAQLAHEPTGTDAATADGTGERIENIPRIPRIRR